ncbi:MAG: flagellar hook-associated protein FlgK [Chlamydiales bacterium]|jgi:flagellar hook-associated protein 1 FlgK|nr:flagellar hook-associated protein FlgK [Chlamydiales bacterium]
MPGDFDGIRLARTGLMAHQTMMEITGNNIANASNEDYTRQVASLDSIGSYTDGRNFYGRGVEISDVKRIRDELLDGQIRNTTSASEKLSMQYEWLSRAEGIYNEPSDTGLAAKLADFWDAFQQLATEPESYAARTNILNKTDQLTFMINDVYDKFTRFREDVDSSLNQIVNQVNVLGGEVANLNDEIFNIETGLQSEANDLRDRRDKALNELSELMGITYSSADNGMVNVFVGTNPLVWENGVQNLEVRRDILDASKAEIVWETGDRNVDVSSGKVSGLLKVRDELVPTYLADINDFSSTLIQEVNKIYSKGVSLNPLTSIDSALSHEAFGVTDTTTELNLVEAGEYGSLHFTFYNDDKEIVRSQGIIIDNDDSFDDILDKVRNIDGIDVVVLSQVEGPDRVRLSINEGEVSLGESGFSISKNAGGFDTSGFLDLLGFNQTDKLESTTASPALISRDLNELKSILGVTSVAEVLDEDLGIAGRFTINGFETLTESGTNKGFLVQQFAIEVESSDSIQDIMDKVNNSLTADYEVTLQYNSTSEKLELISDAMTDSEGNVVLSTDASAADNIRLSFSNSYRYPQDPNDEPPRGDNGLGDTVDFFATIQMNTLMKGSDASDIGLSEMIDSADLVNSGYSIAQGDNSMAMELVNLQFRQVAVNETFTIAENFQNIVSTLASDINDTEKLAENESILLDNYKAEKSRISGVNLDEELSNMIVFQRGYEANARMISILSKMLEDLVNII